jgi:hypothetical protein
VTEKGRFDSFDPMQANGWFRSYVAASARTVEGPDSTLSRLLARTRAIGRGLWRDGRQLRQRQCRQNSSSHPITSAAEQTMTPTAVRASSFRVYPRELSLEEVEVVGDRVEVAARLVDLSQRERVLVLHTHGTAEDDCSNVKSGRSTGPLLPVDAITCRGELFCAAYNG